jgi:hypothetical protein
MSLGRFFRLSALAAVAAAFGAASASAGSSAFDSSGTAGAGAIALPSVLAAPPFLLGEVDLTTLGASPADVTGAGTDGASSSASSGNNGELVVDDDHAQCPEAQFTSIQAAVTAAGPGARIRVCPGTYQEQVTIGPGKDGLTLYSQVPLEAIIKAPAVMTLPNSIVTVDTAHDVSLRAFTITGPFTAPGCAGDLERHTGVRVTNGGSATIDANHITQIRDINPAFFGCQDGIGVLVGRNLEGQTGTAWLTHNTIDAYQKGGVVVDNTGSYAEVDHNVITGEGLTNITAQNGVQVGRGAQADVEHNSISKNQFARIASTDTAAGVLLFETNGGVTVDHNEVFQNGVGIDIDEGALNLEVGHNTVHDNINDGVGAFTGSSNNQIDQNRAYSNTPDDCYDETTGGGTAGTANYWIHDMGNTENRPICKSNPGGDKGN